MPISKRICIICEASAPLSHTIGNSDTLCTDPECKRLWQQKNTTPAIVFKSKVEHRKGVVRKQKAEAEASRQYKQDVINNETQENEEILRLVEMDLSTASGPPRIINVPSGSTNMVPLSEERIALYTENLHKALDAAFTSFPLSEDPEEDNKSSASEPDDLDPVLQNNCDQICAFCQGGCCYAGGNHAFITEKTILRILSANPSFSKADLSEYYLSRIQAISSEDACINQTAEGCLLPREMRSDTCNTYFCDELLDYQKSYDEETEQHDSVLVVKRAYSNWNRLHVSADRKIVNAAAVSSQGIQRLDVVDKK